MADGIAGFIAARLDEDERAAEAVLSACRDSRQPWPPEQAPGRGGPALTEYLRHFSEHRAIREVAARREILTRYETLAASLVHTPGILVARDVLADVIEHFATAWNGHPDYRAEWAP